VTDESSQSDAGVGGEGAKRPPAFTRPIHCNSEEVQIGHVPFLPRYALACWWSITHLIRSEPKGTVWFWTFTSPYAMPLWWFGKRHGDLVCNVKDMARSQVQSTAGGTIPKNWGGVRVFETNPNGTGFHAHWVVRGYYDWHLMQKAALAAGLGKVVWVDPKPASEKLGFYLASYLVKEKLKGARQWSNIGTYDGIGGRDIEIDSPRIREIKAWALYWRGQGDHRYLAYRKACQCVDDGLTLPGAEPF